MKSTTVLLSILATCWTSGCASLRTGQDSISPAPAMLVSWPEDQQQCSIYVVRHGWHTGLAIKGSDILVDDWPEGAEFRSAQYVEIGWGDQAYYRAAFMNPLVIAGAALLPTRSALHVAGIHQPLETYFEKSQIIEIKVSEDRMRRLCRYIRDSYWRDENGSAECVGESIYGKGSFYRARGFYYIPKTCNVWTAQGLAAAECPITEELCTLAEPLVFQCKGLGEEIQGKRSILPVIYPFTGFQRPTD